MKKINRSNILENFHQAKWDEPVVFELSQPGERGILVPEVDKNIKEMFDINDLLPDNLKRKTPLELPEMSQSRVLRHFMRLSQETLGADVNIEIGQGTCTVKYSPKINEMFARNENMTELHPLQDDETVQGILEIMYKLDYYMREISGMEQFTFQPSGGSQAIMAMASLVESYFNDKGEERDEIITTIYSHPSDAAAPALKGYKIIYIQPDENGYPDYEAFKSAVSEKTAAFFIANPEDTGVYNTRVKEFTELVHEKGGLCCYDQANANGLLGVTRAKDAGFDMCFFNLHKTFSTPHGCGGPATGATGVTKELIKYLPKPIIDKKEDGTYYLDYDFSDSKYSVGKIRSFNGVAQVALKAYAWVMSLGAEGLYEVSKVAVLNNNYMFKKMMDNKWIDAPYIKGKQRIEQVRYTIEKYTEETGVTTGDIQRRMMDFGLHYWASHHPYYVPEPITLEPTETPSRADIDQYIDTLLYVMNEGFENPEKVKTAPHSSVCHQLIEDVLDDSENWILSWKIYKKQNNL
ncbi:aminomethyl-transferring glycine dehydrogenase subunit GcvPB [Clostridiaceae bacterium HSG29]|nr:aminomethyl-transferring glycine dehydrogenase subunit GcvPB [Clostridiaceae bacterium HSG29]